MIAFFNGGWLNFHMLQIYLNHNLIIGQRLLKLHYEYATPRFLVGPYNSIVGKVGLAELMLQKEVSEAKVNRYQLKFGNFVFAIVWSLLLFPSIGTFPLFSNFCKSKLVYYTGIFPPSIIEVV